jgi:hypothetical protein
MPYHVPFLGFSQSFFFISNHEPETATQSKGVEGNAATNGVLGQQNATEKEKRRKVREKENESRDCFSCKALAKPVERKIVHVLGGMMCLYWFILKLPRVCWIQCHAFL